MLEKDSVPNLKTIQRNQRQAQGKLDALCPTRRVVKLRMIYLSCLRCTRRSLTQRRRTSKIIKSCLSLQNVALSELKQKEATKKTCILKSSMKGLHLEDQRSRKPRESQHLMRKVARNSNLRQPTSVTRKFLLCIRRSLRISEGLIPTIQAKAKSGPNR